MTRVQPSFFSFARRSFWLLFGGIWLFVGIVMLVFGVVFALREQAFSTNGVVATGIVLEKRFIPADSDSSTEYRVVYRFTTQDGRTVEGSDQVNVETWESVVERGPIDVRYLSDLPESNRLNLGSDLVGAVIFLLFGVVLTVIGGFLVIRALRALRKARRLMSVGVSADATVTLVEPTNVTVNQRPQYRVRYSYADPQGGTHEGDSGYLDFETAHQWSPGDVARIRYDPGKPEESHWLGAADPAAASPSSPAEKPLPVDAPPPVDAAPPSGRPPADATPPRDAPPAG
jgi:uncharacterized protein (DUF58 family)